MVKQWVGVKFEGKKLEMMLKRAGAFGKVSLDYQHESEGDDDGSIEEWE